MYKAPVGEIAHTLKSVAGLSAALEAGKLGDQITDEVRTTLGELEVELKRIREKIDAKQKS